LSRVTIEEILRRNRVQNGVSEKFKSLVALLLQRQTIRRAIHVSVHIVLVSSRAVRFVHERSSIYVDISKRFCDSEALKQGVHFVLFKENVLGIVGGHGDGSNGREGGCF
jgi:ABC-type taurine transport system ATPase subunit